MHRNPFRSQVAASQASSTPTTPFISQSRSATPAAIAGSNPERLMDADEVVIEEVQSHCVRVIFHLLRERIGEPRHATLVHSDIQIVAPRRATTWPTRQ